MTELEKNRTLLVDSNIWLYAFIEGQDLRKSGIAKSVIQDNNSAIIVSTQIINEISVNLIRKTSFSEDEIQQLVVSFYGKYDVVEINKQILLKASEIRNHHKFSFWDSIIFASALYANAEILYSEDMHDGFPIDNTTITNPFG
ncbi:MAG: PIN domain-containing protein [Gammaproteobacteria bacterium]|nr:PIN domain-containing protein [Gammaproteobacteria bacterium]